MNFLPVLFIGIMFGLAMDYEVFLISRMIEESVKYQFLKSGKWLLIGWLVFLYLFVQYLNCGYFFQTDVMSNAALISEVLLLYFSNRLVSTKYLYLGLAVQVLLIFWLAFFI